MTKTMSTPVRNNHSHNYANAQSPIASAKRPRSSLERTGTSGSGSSSISATSKMMVTSTPSGMKTTGGGGMSERTPGLAMSPMHPPRPVPSREDDDITTSDTTNTSGGSATMTSGGTAISNNDSASWVGRKVDALFSPVLSFLSAAKDDDVAAVTDEDATMEEQQQQQLQVNSDSSNINIDDNNSGSMDNEHHNNNEITIHSGDNADADGISNNKNSDSPNNHSNAGSSLTAEDEDNNSMEQAPTATSSTIMLKDTSSVDESCYEDVEDETMRNIEDDPSSSFEEEEFNPFLFIKSLPPYAMIKHTRPPPALGAKSSKMPPVSLVLDLDETLVHCTVEPTSDADLRFPVVFHGVTYQVNVRLRPHLFTFLEKIKDKFEIIIFTASQKVYADELLNLIDPERKYFHQRLFRESCLSVEGNYLKDLHVLQRDLSKTVLVDNSPHAFGYQVDNGIPIESWFDDPNDTELLKLERFLRTLHDVDDVRTAVRYRFQTYQLVDEA